MPTLPPALRYAGCTLRVDDTDREIEARVAIATVGDRVELTLTLPWSAPRARVQSAAVRLRVSDPDARLSIPMARFLPDTPVAVLRSRPRVLPEDGVDGQFPVTVSAPDCIAGTVTVTTVDGVLAVTPAPLDCAVQVYAYGDGNDVIVEHDFICEQWAEPGAELLLARVVLHHDLPAVGRYFAETCAPPPDRPAWAREMSIWEVEPYEHGGWAGLTAGLDTVAGWGFNTLYLMPWHPGSYGTLDYLQVDPRLGDFAGLRALCDAAHARGLHVLFDLLVNIAAEGSPYSTAHPDWFYRDADGAVLRHPLWGGYCLDPASPGFRAFLTDYAVRCCTEWGADGFRVDAVAYRGGNWHSPLGLAPHVHDHAVFTLLDEIRTALRRVRPDAVLLSETFGPLQAGWCDAVCFQWIIYLDWLEQGVRDGALDGATLQRLLADHFAVLPPETWLTFYTHTHDTLAFSQHDFTGPALDALFAHLTLLGAGTMVFGGGWKMPRRPFPDDEATYRALLAAKASLGGVPVGAVSFPPAADRVLSQAARPSAVGPVRVVTNFSPTPRPLPPGAVHYTRLGSSPGTVLPFDTVVVADES